MKLYAPEYYKKFVCIAHKCKHSCCIGWEIDIDSKTLEKYKNLSQGYGKSIINSIDFKETPHFRLGNGEKCPHLNQKGLCEIILNLGEDYLCHICREHPRFYNESPLGIEVGIGMACEEAARIILNSDDYGIFVPVGEVDGSPSETDFDITLSRNRIYSILSDYEIPYNERLRRIYSEFGVAPTDISDGEWQEIIDSLEYLDNSRKGLFMKYSSRLTKADLYEKALERALAYFVFRHCTSAQDEDEFRTVLGFCLFCERLLASLIRSNGAEHIDDIVPLARIVSEEIEYSEDNTYSIMREF